jgi:hypothetical protein
MTADNALERINIGKQNHTLSRLPRDGMRRQNFALLASIPEPASHAILNFGVSTTPMKATR